MWTVQEAKAKLSEVLKRAKQGEPQVIARVEVLNNYIEQMKRRFHGRIVAIDVHLAEVAGRLRGAESKRGRIVSILDSFIAARAIAKGGMLITRNVKHFQGLGFPVANPFED
jgi:hypothetical protein